MVMLTEFGRQGWSAGRTGFRPSSMGSVLRNPVLGQPFRPAIHHSLGDPKTDAANAVAKKLTEGANIIVKNGAALQATLDRVYTEYQSSATKNRLIEALRAAYNALRATDPFLLYITGNVDNQALVRLQAAERLGNQWMASIKESWYGDGPDGVDLHDALIVVDNDLALQVESTFDQVQSATADVAKLARQVDQLPEEILSRGVEYYYAGLKSVGSDVWGGAGDIWSDLGSILKAIKAILDAAGVASNDVKNFLNATFPKPKGASGLPGSNAMSSFPAPGTLILVGLGLVALYIVLK